MCSEVIAYNFSYSEAEAGGLEARDLELHNEFKASLENLVGVYLNIYDNKRRLERWLSGEGVFHQC